MGVVRAGGEAGLNFSAGEEHGGAVESSTQTGDDTEVDIVVASLLAKRTGVAAPDVKGGGLAVTAVVLVASEGVALNATGDIASWALGVDDEGLAAEAFPGLVDVAGVVVGKSARVDRREGFGGEDTNGRAILAPDTVRTPCTAVAALLSNQIIANVRNCATLKTLDFLNGAVVA